MTTLPTSHRLTRRDRFVFQYPPFQAMQPGVLPDFSAPLPGGAGGFCEGFLAYVHIPFCAVRCTFCYYGMMPNTSRELVKPYLEALHEEIDRLADLPYLQGRSLETLYFGGGTPTYLKEEQLEALIGHLRTRFSFADDLEFTCEGEPTTIQESKLRLLRDLGVTRMSFGVQSFHTEIARLNGRIAKPHVVERAIAWAQAEGFPAINIDLMSGMLGESSETWRHTIDTLLGHLPQHITIYRMEIKPGTQFYTKLLFDPELRSKFVGDEDELALFEYADERFHESGYERDSAFSWCRRGERTCRHRLKWAAGTDLIAIGESAFGYANGCLYQNLNPYRPYGQAIREGRLPIGRAHRLTARERMTAYLVMNFKLLRIDRADFLARFGVDPIAPFASEFEQLERAGAVMVRPREILSTDHGRLYADSFVRAFYPPDHLRMDEIALATPPFDRFPMDVADVSALVSPASEGLTAVDS